MTDRSAPSSLTLNEVAELVGGRAAGDPARTVTGVAPVDEAGEAQLAFLASRKYMAHASSSAAAAFLVAEELEASLDGDPPRVVVADPHRALQALLSHLHPPEPHPTGVHPTAVLGRGVELGEGVGVGPYAVLGDGVSVGARSYVGAHCVLGHEARVGEDALLHPHVVLYARTVVGDRAILHSGARLGVDGFGWAFADGVPRKMPHVGRCVVGDDVEIGANSTVDRGSIGDTVIGSHAKLDNLVHLAHNVKLGAMSLLAALVGIAGSTRVGKGVLMGGQSGAANHIEVGDGARIAAATKVMRDVPAGEVVSGNPARPNREYLRKQAQLDRLPKLVARVKALEEAVEGLSG